MARYGQAAYGRWAVSVRGWATGPQTFRRVVLWPAWPDQGSDTHQGSWSDPGRSTNSMAMRTTNVIMLLKDRGG